MAPIRQGRRPVSGSRARRRSGGDPSAGFHARTRSKNSRISAGNGGAGDQPDLTADATSAAPTLDATAAASGVSPATRSTSAVADGPPRHRPISDTEPRPRLLPAQDREYLSQHQKRQVFPVQPRRLPARQAEPERQGRRREGHAAENGNSSRPSARAPDIGPPPSLPRPRLHRRLTGVALKI